MKALCVIPARGQSKRIPRKNIRPFFGKPIIALAIEAAQASRVFDTVMVSTEDEEIAEVSRTYGAEVPFLRSPDTAGDNTGLAEVVLEVLTAYRSIGMDWDIVCCLLPTSVFATGAGLREDVLSLGSKATGIVRVVAFDYPVQRCLRIDGSGHISMVAPQHLNDRSQDLEPRYHDAGQYYIIPTQVIRRERTLFPVGAIGRIVSETAAHDIDTEEDWLIAELKYKLFLDRSRG